MRVCHSHNHLAGRLHAALLLALLAKKAESEGGLRRRTALRDVDDAELASAQILGKLIEIVLADIVAGEEHDGIGAVVGKPLETVAKCLKHGARAEVAAADAGHDNRVTVGAKHLCRLLQLGKELGRGLRSQVHPAKEVAAGAAAFLQSFLRSFHARRERLDSAGGEKAAGLACFQMNVLTHFSKRIVFVCCVLLLRMQS